MFSFSCVLLALLASSAVYSASIKNDFETALIGPQECLDSSFWCTNFTTSIQCNAAKHCIQTVWQNSKTQLGDSCGTCESEIQTIRDSINSNTTKTVLDDLLVNICDLTYITEVFRKTCEKYIDQYVDANLNELLDLLSSEVDAGTICHLLGFCASETVASAPAITQYQDDAIVRFENIELHFPASYLDLSDMNSLLGASKCTWGPSYWCNNITSAHECGTAAKCVEEVWSQNYFPEDNDSVCQICKDMVKQARDQLQSNETQEELKQVFEGSCKLIYIKPIVKECIALADDFIPELTEMLVSSMNPTAVCSVAGLCNSPRIDKLIAANPGGVTEMQLDSCSNCTVAFTTIERYLHNTPKNKVMNKILQLCGELSTFSDSCATLVTKYDQDVYSYLTSLQPWSACHLSGMCSHQFHMHSSDENLEMTRKAEVALKAASDDLPCDLCKQLVTHFKEILVANTTEDEFLQVLRGICEQTGKFKDECLELVNSNFKIIYNFLTTELDPAKICSEVNLCPRSNFVSDINLNLIQDRFPSVISSDVEVFTPAKTSISSAIECRFCKYIIQIVQNQLENPTVEHDVEKIVKQVCTLVSSAEKPKCVKFVDQYSRLVIDILAQDTDPGTVCQVIDLCPDVRLVESFEFCPLCQNALHFVQTELEDPKTEQQIEDAVKKVCTVVPQAEARQCNEFVSQYSALIISVLAEEIDPSLVCPALKLCPDLHAEQSKCQTCTSTVQSLIRSLPVRDPVHVYHGMKNLMKSVPKNLTSIAVQLQIEHASEIVDMMMAEFNAQESCTYLQYCSQYPKGGFLLGGDVATNEIEGSSSEVVIKSVSKPSCQVCEIFVKIYEDKLTSKTSEEELEQLLTKYCNQITDEQLKQNCTILVDKYVPKLIDLLKKDVQPKELCQLAKICPMLSDTVTVEKCRSCEATLGSLQGILADPYVMNVGLNQVDRICSYINPKNRNICNAIVLQLGRELEGIVLGIPSWYYCSKLHMCPYAADMILTEECAAGESFWCRGQQTAQVCDKLQYCRDNVWKNDA